MDDLPTRLAKRLFDRQFVQNSFRGAFVEELIAPHLQPFGWAHCGDDWGSWDFEHESGTRLELKQSAAIQSWSKSDAEPMTPSFSIERKSGYYHGATWISSVGRPAHIYAFAWHGVLSRDEADHRRVDQWQFFPVLAARLPAEQKSIRLSVVKGLSPKPCSAHDLGEELARLRTSIG